MAVGSGRSTPGSEIEKNCRDFRFSLVAISDRNKA